MDIIEISNMSLLFAQAKAAAGGTANALFQFLPFIIIFVLFWFLIIRPQRKRENEHKELLNALKKGDKVVTSSGIYGEVYSLTPQTVMVEISPKVKITLQRSSIAAIVLPEVYASIQQHAPVSTSSSENTSKSLKKKKK